MREPVEKPPVRPPHPLDVQPGDERRVWKPEKRVGRPFKKFSAASVKTVLTAIRSGATRATACKWARLNLNTFRRRIDDDPRFREAIENAEAHWEMSQLSKVSTDKDPKSARWALSHHPRTRQQFGDNSPQTNVNVGVMNAVPGYDLAAMLERIEQRRLDPRAPRDPRPALVAAQSQGSTTLHHPAQQETVDAEIVKPKRTPVPAFDPKEFVEELEKRRADGPLPD